MLDAFAEEAVVVPAFAAMVAAFAATAVRAGYALVVTETPRRTVSKILLVNVSFKLGLRHYSPLAAFKLATAALVPAS